MFLVLQRGSPGSEIVDSENNQPFIVKLFDADGDISSQYFIVIEQTMMIECNSVMSSLFTLFAVHYVFNIQYHSRLKDLFQFLEEKVVSIKSGAKKSAVYLSVTTAAENYLPAEDPDKDW